MMRNYILHYNHNHDPKNGRFSNSKNGNSRKKIGEKIKKIKNDFVEGFNAGIQQAMIEQQINQQNIDNFYRDQQTHLRNHQQQLQIHMENNRQFEIQNQINQMNQMQLNNFLALHHF